MAVQRETITAGSNRLADLLEQGQSAWLDFINRAMLHNGDLQRLIDAEGLRGLTSNPTIFEQAIAAGDDYDAQIRELVTARQPAEIIFEALAVRDIQEACDRFYPLYERTGGADGFVSFEVSPGLAHNTEGALNAARHLWRSIGRPNVMIKIPATDAGLPAIEQLLTEGVNINITLLFSLQTYERVLESHLTALERRAEAGLPIERLASVASFFVSRVDTLVDRLLEERIARSRDQADQGRLSALLGRAAIANARLAYAHFRTVVASERFARLRDRGAHMQRLLWASTSTKNPTYRDVYYVEELIGPDTVNTMPLATLRAFQDHGEVQRTLDRDLDAARAVWRQLQAAGIDYAAVTAQLETEGIDAFDASHSTLIAGVEQKRADLQREIERKQPPRPTDVRREVGGGVSGIANDIGGGSGSGLGDVFGSAQGAETIGEGPGVDASEDQGDPFNRPR